MYVQKKTEQLVVVIGMTKHHLYMPSIYRTVSNFFFILTANISFRPSSTYMGSKFNRQVQNDLQSIFFSLK